MAESGHELTEILTSAMDQKAESIHFDPQEQGLLIKYRADSRLKAHRTVPFIMWEALLNQIKRQSGLDPTMRKFPQEGHLEIKIRGASVECRVSTMPTIIGESVVIRIMEPSAKRLKLAELGFIEENEKRIERAIRPHNTGLVLISGPSVSGKTTSFICGNPSFTW